MSFTKLTLGAALGAMLTTGFAASHAAAQEHHYIPVFSYRTGAFAGSGIPQANGEMDYYTMLNERDGGIGGVKNASVTMPTFAGKVETLFTRLCGFGIKRHTVTN